MKHASSPFFASRSRAGIYPLKHSVSRDGTLTSANVSPPIHFVWYMTLFVSLLTVVSASSIPSNKYLFHWHVFMIFTIQFLTLFLFNMIIKRLVYNDKQHLQMWGHGLKIITSMCHNFNLYFNWFCR